MEKEIKKLEELKNIKVGKGYINYPKNYLQQGRYLPVIPFYKEKKRIEECNIEELLEIFIIEFNLMIREIFDNYYNNKDLRFKKIFEKYEKSMEPLKEEENMELFKENDYLDSVLIIWLMETLHFKEDVDFSVYEGIFSKFKEKYHLEDLKEKYCVEYLQELSKIESVYPATFYFGTTPFAQFYFKYMEKFLKEEGIIK